MADESNDLQRARINTGINYFRGIIFLGLSALFFSRKSTLYIVIGVVFALYGIWRIYNTYSKNRISNDQV